MFQINFRYTLMIFLLALISSKQIYANETPSREHFIIYPPEIVIEYEPNRVLISSEKTDNLNHFSETKWSIYQIKKDSISRNFQRTFWGNAYSDEEINSIINEYDMPSGIYGLVLTITDEEDISSSSEKLILLKRTEAQKKYGYITKKALKNLIKSLRSGQAKSLLPTSVHKKINEFIIPPLEKLLKYEDVFGQNVVGALISGLTSAGVGQSTARRTAELIVAVFL
ncbi:MAG: hypothetical protein E6Q60_00860 [Nitrosomonas oligotropha]|uniref:Uncharacterized protein n=1 Tax=Nitrosomonas oligotropha TaxID=42354 RepID=A0A5C7W030_9PROT|nr:MAG: hypothetical protein E6Q60_00860 [Nitrosomonas oligotropha]